MPGVRSALMVNGVPMAPVQGEAAFAQKRFLVRMTGYAGSSVLSEALDDEVGDTGG